MKCEKCGKACEALLCKTNPSACEWYCADCHKSYDMDRNDIARHGIDPTTVVRDALEV